MGRIRGKFTPDTYNPKVLTDAIRADGQITTIDGRLVNEKTIRADYSELRRIALDRLERFVGTEWEDSQVYRYNKNRFKKLSEIKSPEELSSLLTDVHTFVNAKTGSVTGLVRQRAETIETLHDHGYDFVNRSNFRQFTDFMDNMRRAHISRILDSERLTDLFKSSQERAVTPEELKNAMVKYIAENGSAQQLANIQNKTSEEIWEGLNIGSRYNTGTPSKSSKRHSVS